MGVPRLEHTPGRGWKASTTATLASIALAVRHHYMLGATTVVLAIAAAGGLGYFDDPVPARQSPGLARSPTLAAFDAGPGRTAAVVPFEFNLFLVGTLEQQQAIQTVEKQFRNPLPGGRASEVLLVITAEDEVYAAHHVEEVRMSFPGANVVITDLR